MGQWNKVSNNWKVESRPVLHFPSKMQQKKITKYVIKCLEVWVSLDYRVCKVERRKSLFINFLKMAMQHSDVYYGSRIKKFVITDNDR